jgi:hypothetical protein
MKKLLVLLLLFIFTTSYSQTITIGTIQHFGKYHDYTATYTESQMLPTFDWEFGLGVPLTKRIYISTSLYYYNSKYEDVLPPKYTTIEKYWYVGLRASYTFPMKPIFD